MFHQSNITFVEFSSWFYIVILKNSMQSDKICTLLFDIGAFRHSELRLVFKNRVTVILERYIIDNFIDFVCSYFRFSCIRVNPIDWQQPQCLTTFTNAYKFGLIPNGSYLAHLQFHKLQRHHLRTVSKATIVYHWGFLGKARNKYHLLSNYNHRFCLVSFILIYHTLQRMLSHFTTYCVCKCISRSNHFGWVWKWYQTVSLRWCQNGVEDSSKLVRNFADFLRSNHHLH